MKSGILTNCAALPGDVHLSGKIYQNNLTIRFKKTSGGEDLKKRKITGKPETKKGNKKKDITMKKVTLVFGMLLAVLITNAQSVENKSEIENKSEKSPAIMVEPDSTLIEMEYARFDSYSEVETWQQVITPDSNVFYC